MSFLPVSFLEVKFGCQGELPGLPALQRVTTIQPSPASPLAKVWTASPVASSPFPLEKTSSFGAR